VSPTAPPSTDSAAAIADAELRLAMLRRMASLGMRLVEEVCERAINSPYHPEVKHEPCRAFATVSRAVRLTLVLQAKTEADLIALRNGKPVVAERASGPRETTKAAPKATADGDLDDATSDPARETLRDRERFDEFPLDPYDDCVAAIRAGFGLAPEDDIPSCSAGVPPATFAAYKAEETSALRIGSQDPPDSG
jgi:hypothetical protein